MAPPKTDAFADLFSSATSNSSSSSLNEKRMPMSHRQNRQQSPLNGSNLQPSTASTSQDHWSNLDILSGSHTPTGSSNHTSSSVVDDDPFSIFGKPEPKTAPGLAEPTPTHQSTIGAPDQSTLLLDDEFSDAFPAEKTAIPAKNAVPERSSKSSPEPSSSPNDSVLAQLVDIGFSVDTANDAIAKKGPHLQECVNYIMSGGNSETTSQRSTPVQRHQAHQPEDLQAKLTDLSTDFFNKASIFFDKSKKTVMKNLDQFQQQHMAHRGQSSSPGMPSWMANQEKYKKDAVERKANGGSYEDYGSDDDNLDKEAIEQFMRKQQERDKERKEKRLQGIKAYAMDRVSGRPESASGRTSPAKKPDMPIRPQSQPSSDDLPRRPPRKTKAATPTAATPKAASPVAASKGPEEDLLGLNASTSVTAAPLTEFQQTDFDTNKEKASVSFSHGDYDSAYQSYLRCMESLPENHDYRIVINSNAALTLVKLGNYKEAKNHCDIGIKLLDVRGIDNGWTIMDKSAKHWYTKLLMRKAESLEMLEVFPEALECYMELVSRLGVSDKKVMDGKRRVNDIVNPKPKPKPANATAKPTPKPASKAPKAPKPTNTASNLTRMQKQNAEAKAREEEMFKLHDKVHEQLQAWSNGKEDNIRTLLTTLPDIIPERLGFPFVSDKKIGLGDLMLPKKVKINYMKVISAIHPDKLSNLQLQDKMICQGVFVVLNKAWDTFKQQNNMA